MLRPSGSTTTTPPSWSSRCEPDLKYSDGTPLNAERYAYAIKRNINPETAGEYAAITDEIAGAPEWRGFTADEAKTEEENAAAKDAAAAVVAESIKASHADGAACEGYEDAACDTLTLTFSKPAPYFHTVMSLWVTYPAKEENITEGGENWWNSSKFQIGNGPYVLESLEPFVRGLFHAQRQLLGRPAEDRHRVLLHQRQRRGVRGLQEQRVRHHRRWPPRTSQRFSRTLS